jgi:hypothetical protein
MKRGAVLAVLTLGWAVSCADAQTAPDDQPPAAGPGIRAEAEYLLWFIKPLGLRQAVVTLGSPNDAVPGALGQPGTTVALGAGAFHFGAVNGARAALDEWFLADDLLGVQVSGFVLESVAGVAAFRSGPDGAPASYLPYQDPAGNQRAIPFTTPGLLAGSSTAVGNRKLWGAEASLISCVHEGARRSPFGEGDLLVRVTALAGFRYLDLADSTLLTNELLWTPDPNLFALGQDLFTARNRFYGGQVGARVALVFDALIVDATAKLAAGATSAAVNAEGGPRLLRSFRNEDGFIPGPLLVLPSNRGRRSRTVASVVGEVGVNARYQVTDWLRLTAGYAFLGWQSVAGPGGPASPTVNVTQLPGQGPLQGPVGPAAAPHLAGFYAHGLCFGAEVVY